MYKRQISLLLGSITILGICLEFGRPEKVQVLPASTLLNTPYPDETFPRIVTSPPPTYITLGSSFATAIEPMLPPKYPSEIFSYVSPPFSVFQTPPPVAPK